MKGFILHNMQKIPEISEGKHVMLLCEDEEQRAQSAAEWINHGLEEGQHCIMLPSMLLINFINQVFLEFRQR